MIEKRTTHITPFGLDRCLHIYLPDDYYISDKSYPVLYMFDGHNLYLDSDATYGHAWHIADTFAKQQVKMIVVGLECNHEGRERLNEFCPYVIEKSRLGSLDGRGKSLMTWMTTALKEEIDGLYRTNGINYLGGSSMGGLMALYGIVAHGDVYQGAACLSSSIFLCMDELKQEIRHALHLKGARIYMSYGSEEADSKTRLATIVKGHMELSELLKEKQANVYFDMVINGSHNEATWETQVMDFIDYLRKDQ